MKILSKIAFSIALITCFAACQLGSDPKQMLANKETRKGIMEAIANNGDMTTEMMEALMSSQNGKTMLLANDKMALMMMESPGTMMKKMKDNPGMMQDMMAKMMESCKNDSSMMSGMCKTMMANQPMMDMMQKMKDEKMDMGKMKGGPHKM